MAKSKKKQIESELATIKERQASGLHPGLVLPEFTLLPDHPIQDDEDERAAGFAARLGSVLDIVRHSATLCPIAVAIYGDWGTGKTSAMKWLERQLIAWNNLVDSARGEKLYDPNGKVAPHPKVYSVWFEPWKYQTREDVWRGLIAEIILHCISAKNMDMNNAGTRLRETASRFGRFLGKSFLDALSRVKFKTDSMEVSGEAFRDVVDEFHKVNHPEKAYLNDFEETLKSWVTGHLRPEASGREAAAYQKDKHYVGDRMAVFIDDLDRCLPSVTLEVLEALKLYLNIPQLIFIVGLDRTVVDAIVRKHYSEFEVDPNKVGKLDEAEHARDERVLQEKSRKYLDKMFQVEIDITPSKSSADEFARDQIKALDEKNNGFWSKMLDEKYRLAIEDVILYLAEKNPREIKRLLNSTLTRAVEAANDTRLRDSDDEISGLSVEDARKLRFAQGAQVFLIQRIVKHEYRRIMGNPFFDPSAKDFFESWNQFISSVDNNQLKFWEQPLTGHRINKEWQNFRRHRKATEQKRRDESEAAESKRLAGKPMAEEQPIKIPSFAQNWSEELLGRLQESNAMWRIMTVPFANAVSESAPQDTRIESADSASTVDLSGVPAELQQIIADAANVTAEELVNSKNQIEGIESLDFSYDEKIDNILLSTLLAVFGSWLSSLQHLNLGGTQVRELGPLEKLSSLLSLNLGGTQVSELGPLEKLSSLQYLYLTGTQVSELGPLEKLSSLQYLDLTGTQVSELGPLEKPQLAAALGFGWYPGA